MRQFLLSMVLILASQTAFAQITGKVIDAESKDPLQGATIVIKGTQTGIISGFDGSFKLQGASAGEMLQVSFIGFETMEIAAKEGMVVALVPKANLLGEIVITSNVIDVAKERETPVAITTIAPSEITLKVGNMEFPEIMNRTPGVYTTKEGGGYGDSRLSLRGFTQSNTSFLINGQPVNDMENGWVYWSNWQGMTDVASGIQIQRGLGASRLAVPSVGGTVSIFTKAAEVEEGGTLTQGIGNDGYVKTSASYNTGKNDRGWASSFLLSRWSGNGYVNGTSGEGWNYFAAVGYAPEGSSHALNLSVLGAGQWHHQRSSWVSIRDYINFGESGVDRKWNTDAGELGGEEFNMRRNFYNKPLATFNWDWEISNDVTLATSLYGSAGRGGGTGPRGNNFRNSDIDLYPFNIDLTQHLLEDGKGAASRNADGSIDFDNVVAVNRGTTSPYTGAISGFQGQLIGSNGFRNDGVNRAVLVRRASMNSHNWVGGISTLDITKDKWRYSVGVDLRSYTGFHYRALENLMGLDGYYSTGNSNSAGQIQNVTISASPFRNTGLEREKIDYFNTGIVGWQGFNGLIEYNNESSVTAVLQAGYSNQSFKREDFFDQPANPISEKKNIGGGYVKGGANYNLDERSNFFFNAGYISRQPLFDAVFPNFANNVNTDLQNEEITSIELGYGYVNNSLKVNVNAYSTNWGNRFISQGVSLPGGIDGTAQFKDVDVRHMGLELEVDYRYNSQLKFKGMVSAGDWRYVKDFDATVFNDQNQSVGNATLYVKDAKVGDAAQFTSYFEAEYKIGKLNFDLAYRFVDGLYADYSINNTDFLQPNNKGALKLPSYGLVDLGSTVRFDLLGNSSSFRVNVNNLFNTLYISESNTNIHRADESAPAWKGIDYRNSVWFGFGTTWNATLRINF
ncbi:TonB-dependent receptor [uncultured Roseivirga sp.]|uniref:TonB-dependent receptor n=1 Tax=uncultured Roseivirga sp. TaxID=543088 RepID=UPI0030DD727D|tara:strand:+ start:2888 stop:5608 length:2721 start_codon:yes stop_codon:yes gene_type:complete